MQGDVADDPNWKRPSEFILDDRPFEELSDTEKRFWVYVRAARYISDHGYETPKDLSALIVTWHQRMDEEVKREMRRDVGDSPEREDG